MEIVSPLHPSTPGDVDWWMRCLEQPRAQLASGVFSLQDAHKQGASWSPVRHRHVDLCVGGVRGKSAGDPPSWAAVDWALSRHCSASFSIFEVSGARVSPPSREQETRKLITIAFVTKQSLAEIKTRTSPASPDL